MSEPSTAREALIVEAIGDVARLLDCLEDARIDMDATSQALKADSAALRDELAAFEQRTAAVMKCLQVEFLKYMATRGDQATRRSIDEQSRAMADAARVAFGAELGATMQRLQATLRSLLDARGRRHWEAWLTHAAVALATSAAWLGAWLGLR